MGWRDFFMKQPHLAAPAPVGSEEHERAQHGGAEGARTHLPQ